ncbi:MAG: signal peptidase I [Firmicutes bacterium]|nr:signal peptidase I [Bacillota bacterium]
MQDPKYTTPEQIEAMRQAIFRAKGRRGRRKKERSRLARVTGRVFFSIVIVLMLAALVSIQVAKSRGKTPDLLGYQLYMIESGSMEPTLPVGAVILSRKPKDASRLKENEIVTFRNESGLTITHRIIEVIVADDGTVSYRTKGDNPISSPDLELLTPDRVIAVLLWKMPFT